MRPPGSRAGGPGAHTHLPGHGRPPARDPPRSAHGSTRPTWGGGKTRGDPGPELSPHRSSTPRPPAGSSQPPLMPQSPPKISVSPRPSKGAAASPRKAQSPLFPLTGHPTRHCQSPALPRRSAALTPRSRSPSRSRFSRFIPIYPGLSRFFLTHFLLRRLLSTPRALRRRRRTSRCRKTSSAVASRLAARENYNSRRAPRAGKRREKREGRIPRGGKWDENR